MSVRQLLSEFPPPEGSGQICSPSLSVHCYDLFVDEKLYVGGPIVLAGGIELGGNLEIEGNLIVDGTSTLTGAVSSTTINNSGVINTANLVVQFDAQIGEDLTVVGNSNLNTISGTSGTFTDLTSTKDTTEQIVIVNTTPIPIFSLFSSGTGTVTTMQLPQSNGNPLAFYDPIDFRMYNAGSNVHKDGRIDIRTEYSNDIVSGFSSAMYVQQGLNFGSYDGTNTTYQNTLLRTYYHNTITAASFVNLSSPTSISLTYTFQDNQFTGFVNYISATNTVTTASGPTFVIFSDPKLYSLMNGRTYQFAVSSSDPGNYIYSYVFRPDPTNQVTMQIQGPGAGVLPSSTQVGFADPTGLINCCF